MTTRDCEDLVAWLLWMVLDMQERRPLPYVRILSERRYRRYIRRRCRQEQ